MRYTICLLIMALAIAHTQAIAPATGRLVVNTGHVTVAWKQKETADMTLKMRVFMLMLMGRILAVCASMLPLAVLSAYAFGSRA
jgi:hypothetical protein